MKQENLLTIIDGNFGAMRVVEQLYLNYNYFKAEQILKYLLDNNITGSDLWILYKDNNNENITDMVNSLNI